LSHLKLGGLLRRLESLRRLELLWLGRGLSLELLRLGLELLRLSRGLLLELLRLGLELLELLRLGLELLRLSLELLELLRLNLELFLRLSEVSRFIGLQTLRGWNSQI